MRAGGEITKRRAKRKMFANRLVMLMSLMRILVDLGECFKPFFNHRYCQLPLRYCLALARDSSLSHCLVS